MAEAQIQLTRFERMLSVVFILLFVAGPFVLFGSAAYLWSLVL